jgi:Tfp pilus assembly protein FimT
MPPDRRRPGSSQREPAWTLGELLVAAALAGMLAALGARGGAETLARQRLQAASQRVVVGLEEARAAALREGQACGLRLDAAGWQAPHSSALAACRGVEPGLDRASDVEMSHNLPDPVRFSANGLVLDGGTVWLRSKGTALVRCVVVSLPLGITRVGREGPDGCMPESGP